MTDDTVLDNSIPDVDDVEFDIPEESYDEENLYLNDDEDEDDDGLSDFHLPEEE